MFQRFHEIKSMQESEMEYKPKTDSNKVITINPYSNSFDMSKMISSQLFNKPVGNSELGITYKRPQSKNLNIYKNEMSNFQSKKENSSRMSVPLIRSNNDNKYNESAQAAALEVLSSLNVTKTLPNNINLVKGKCTEASEGHFACHMCSHIFKNVAQLKSHYWRHTGIKPFKCDICQSSFTQLTNLKTHQRIHTGERPYECFECGANFTQISNLKTHQKLHTGEKPFVCEMCHARFTQQSNLKSHRLIHTGERPFKCKYCEASFVQSTHLRNHQRIHTNEKPYACKHCSAAFRQLSNLRTHEKTHTGEKPFICEECGSGFVQKSNLKAHKLKLHLITDNEPPNRRGRKGNHGGIGPFICSHCSAEFSSSANMRAHYRVHSGEKPFQCTICFARFAQKSNLKAHEMTHSDMKPFACPDCLSSFKQKGNLRTHMLKKHQGGDINIPPALNSASLNLPTSTLLSESLVHFRNPVQAPNMDFTTPSSSVVTSQLKKGHRVFVINENKNSDEPIVQIDGNLISV